MLTLALAVSMVGEVTHLQSHWQGRRIVSEIEVAGQGRLRILGGTVDGIGMRVSDLPKLEVGDRVQLWIGIDGAIDSDWVRAATKLPTRRSYTRAETAVTHAPVAWLDSNCVTVVMNALGSDDISAPSRVETVLQQAAIDWAQATGDCAYLQVVVDASKSGVIAEYSPSGPFENVIVWLEDNWGHPKDGIVYPKGRTALTTLFYVDDETSPDNGRLLDADIELNGVEWAFTDGDCDQTVLMADLENTLVHELGHVLGLDHTCDSGSGEPPTDHQGQPLPSCVSASAEVSATTMYALAPPCATYMRTPEFDDVLGICSVYPTAKDPLRCAAPEPLTHQEFDAGGWCAMAYPMPRQAPSRAFLLRETHRKWLTAHFVLLLLGLVGAFAANRFLMPDRFLAHWLALIWSVVFFLHLVIFSRATLATMGRSKSERTP